VPASLIFDNRRIDVLLLADLGPMIDQRRLWVSAQYGIAQWGRRESLRVTRLRRLTT
jgi:hypothetical protein